MACDCLLKDMNDKDVPFTQKTNLYFFNDNIISNNSWCGSFNFVLKITHDSDSNNAKKSDNFISESFIESIEPKWNPDQGFFRPVYITMTPNSFINKTNTPLDDIYHLRCDISQFSQVVNNDQDK